MFQERALYSSISGWSCETIVNALRDHLRERVGCIHHVWFIEEWIHLSLAVSEADYFDVVFVQPIWNRLNTFWAAIFLVLLKTGVRDVYRIPGMRLSRSCGHHRIPNQYGRSHFYVDFA